MSEFKDYVSEKCYICGIELNPIQTSKMNIRSSYSYIQGKYPEITKWNGKKEFVCVNCYKSVQSDIETYHILNNTES